LDLLVLRHFGQGSSSIASLGVVLYGFLIKELVAVFVPAVALK